MYLRLDILLHEQCQQKQAQYLILKHWNTSLREKLLVLELLGQLLFKCKSIAQIVRFQLWIEAVLLGCLSLLRHLALGYVRQRLWIELVELFLEIVACEDFEFALCKLCPHPLTEL